MNYSSASFNGKVISIDLRYTKLEAGGNKVLIPNAKLFTDPIIVFDLTWAFVV